MLEIEGGIPLRGEVEIGGAKNAALPLLAQRGLVNALVEPGRARSRCGFVVLVLHDLLGVGRLHVDGP